MKNHYIVVKINLNIFFIFGPSFIAQCHFMQLHKYFPIDCTRFIFKYFFYLFQKIFIQPNHRIWKFKIIQNILQKTVSTEINIYKQKFYTDIYIYTGAILDDL